MIVRLELEPEVCMLRRAGALWPVHWLLDPTALGLVLHFALMELWEWERPGLGVRFARCRMVCGPVQPLRPAQRLRWVDAPHRLHEKSCDQNCRKSNPMPRAAGLSEMSGRGRFEDARGRLSAEPATMSVVGAVGHSW